MVDQEMKQGEPKGAQRDALSQKLDQAGWALFLIWVGVAILAGVGWGWGLLGVGLITVGEQAVRWYVNLKLEVFWIVCGLMFLVGGFWELFNVPYPLVPILLVLGGLAVLWGAVTGKHIMKK